MVVKIVDRSDIQFKENFELFINNDEGVLGTLNFPIPKTRITIKLLWLLVLLKTCLSK